MRSLLLALSILVALGTSSVGCSSSDSEQTTDTGANACVAAGGRCAFNIPFTCTDLNTEAATDPARASACGKSDEDTPRDIQCCIPRATPLDTGTAEDTSSEDTSADASSDASGDSSTADAAEGG